MRLESNRARGTFNQLRIALLHGLTCKLFSLYYQIEVIRSELEVRFTPSLSILQPMTVYQVAIDKQQLNNMDITSAAMTSPDSKHVF